ncbi:MAG: isoprenylcysteine carboxylmethyltransferase family protein [Anaerolineae bacterium]|nr:isoprenylcysteine carboxylmethyltransferase family protein [Anaerolineae bacterium]
MSAQASPQQAHESANWTKFVVRMVIIVLLFPLLLFLSAGRLDWEMGWIYVILATISTAGSRYLMIRRNPGLLEERTTALNREDTKSWDKILVPIIAVVAPLSQIIVAGLDFRFDWSPPFALWIEVLGVGLLTIGYLFATCAMITNAFFSSTVRIQTDRGQQVVTEGPYRIVRHPGYSGLMLGAIGTSLILSSLWSLIPAAIMVSATIIRTRLEDATLHHELPGYREYAQKTRYRLLPGLW